MDDIELIPKWSQKDVDKQSCNFYKRLCLRCLSVESRVTTSPSALMPRAGQAMIEFAPPISDQLLLDAIVQDPGCLETGLRLLETDRTPDKKACVASGFDRTRRLELQSSNAALSKAESSALLDEAAHEERMSQSFWRFG